MFIRYLWLAIGWSLIILILTLTPGEKFPEVHIFQIDKLVHFFVFGLLMLLSSYGLKNFFSAKDVHLNPALMACIYSMSLGIAAEIFQLFVPNRSFSVVDVIANAVGVGLGYFIFSVLKRRNFF